MQRSSRGKALAQPVRVDVSSLCQRGDVGVMLTPAGGDRRGALDEWPCRFAVDTGNYTRPVEPAAYLAYLATLGPYADRCLFATAPDRVGDWAATWEMSAPMLPEIRALGFPAAIVLQDGCEALPDPSLWDVVFIGGSTAWKLTTGYERAGEAKALGRWVHQGRCNSWIRIRAAAAAGCDSADGTCLAYNPAQYVREIAGWLDRLKTQPPMVLA